MAQPVPLQEIMQVDQSLTIPTASDPEQPGALSDKAPCESSLSAPAPSLDATTAQTHVIAAPPPKRITTWRVLASMPAQEDINGAAEAFWVELPSRFEWDGDLSRCIRFHEEVNRTQLAASCGISPAYHGCALVGHSSPRSLYDRIRYPTGIMLSCPWLHVLIKNELRKLHVTSPHAGSPVGVIVTSRAQCTLSRGSKPTPASHGCTSIIIGLCAFGRT